MIFDYNILIYILFGLSVTLNTVLIWFLRRYIKSVNKDFYLASETASAIFTYLHTYREHFKEIYEWKDVYGNSSFLKLLQHTDSLLEFLRQFENITSLTQPELEDILENLDIENEEEKEEGS